MNNNDEHLRNIILCHAPHSNWNIISLVAELTRSCLKSLEHIFVTNTGSQAARIRLIKSWTKNNRREKVSEAQLNVASRKPLTRYEMRRMWR